MVLGTVGCSRAHPYRAVAVLLIHENGAITRRPSVTHGSQRKTQSMENNCGAVARNIGMVTRLCLHRRECRRIQLARNANVTAIGALDIATAAVSRVNGALTIFLYSMRFGKRMQLTGYSGTSTRRECAALASAGTDAALLKSINSEIDTAHQNLDSQVALQNNPFGTRPYKANLTGRYRFATGPLKGAFVGGAGRFQSRKIGRAHV